MSREVILYTRKDCGLCDEAAADLRALQGELGFSLVSRDIDDDPALRGEYNERVPVIAADGHVIAEPPIDRATLRARLHDALR